MKTCNTASDCTNTGNTVCLPYTWVPSLPDGGTAPYAPDAGPITTLGRKICQCTSALGCRGTGDAGSSAVCGDEDKVCENPCRTSSDCRSNRTCQVASGQCRTTPPAPITCNAGNAQPDVCLNGQTCSSNVCQAVPTPNCGNFSSEHQGVSTWTPSNNAPVIYSIRTVAGFPQTDGAFCPSPAAPNRYNFTVSAYWVGGTFPTTGPGLTAILHYVKDDGSEGPSPAITPSSIQLSNGNHNVQFDANFCAASSSSLTIGLHFFTAGVAGNGVCGTEP